VASPCRQCLPRSERFHYHRWGAAPAIDWTLAARTGLFDVDATDWSAEMMAAAAVDAPWLAEVPFPNVCLAAPQSALSQMRLPSDLGFQVGQRWWPAPRPSRLLHWSWWQGRIGVDVRAGLK
jgi:hypothetical protein